jgi:adenine-specific DNA-methyltransferase
MSAIEQVEQERLEAQSRLDAEKSPAERNRLGQFATPTALAVEILRYAKTLLPERGKLRFLDPAIGTGSFYSALVRVFSQSRVDAALGFEIDPQYARKAQALWGDTPLKVVPDDFTKAVPPEDDAEKATLVICNPPYVRHHHLVPDDKIRLHNLSARAAGVNLSGLAGLYCHFLCIAHQWMARDGLAGWLIPSEFMDVNYGLALKLYLLSKVTLLRIHRFDPADVQFDDALVSSAVVWFKKAPPPEGHASELTYGGTLLEPRLSRHVTVEALHHSPKWTKYPMATEAAAAKRKGPVLADLLTIKRGIATGSNDFFILAHEKAKQLDLPARFLKPILPSPRYLDVDEIQADSQGNPLIKHKLLLDCNLHPNQVRDEYPALWAYLESGAKAGVSAGYLCTHRSPWYAQERRPPARFICTYMGRHTKEARGPFRFILNHSKVTAANTYLLLYPKAQLAKVLMERPEAAVAIWRELNSIPVEAILGEGRIYGGGLYKIEPRELANAPAQGVFEAVAGMIDNRSEQTMLFE